MGEPGTTTPQNCAGEAGTEKGLRDDSRHTWKPMGGPMGGGLEWETLQPLSHPGVSPQRQAAIQNSETRVQVQKRVFC